MGEIAEMMLEGDLCGGCGVYLEGMGQGFQRFCPDCKRDGTGQSDWKPPAEKVRCPQCGKRVKAIGLGDHIRDAHKGA